MSNIHLQKSTNKQQQKNQPRMQPQPSNLGSQTSQSITFNLPSCLSSPFLAYASSTQPQSSSLSSPTGVTPSLNPSLSLSPLSRTYPVQLNPNDPSQFLTSYRETLTSESQLYLFNNFNFQHKGTKIGENLWIGDLDMKDNKNNKDNKEKDSKNNIHKQKQKENEKQGDKNNIIVEIVFSPYDYMTAQYHVAKFMQIVFNPQIYAILQKSNLQSSSPTPSLSHSSPLSSPTSSSPILDFQNLKPDLTHPYFYTPTQLSSHKSKLPLLISISLSGFNPPPTSARLNGDLFYIHARTLQGQDLHITASPTGFFVNASKISCFNPAKNSVYKGVFASLVELFRCFSEKFRQNLEKMIKETKITDAMKYKFFSLNRISKKYWLQFSEQEHGWSQRKTIDDAYNNHLYQLRDWNQMFQAQVPQPTQSQKSENQQPQLLQPPSSSVSASPSQLSTLSTLSKLYSQFQSAAIHGTVLLLDGKIPPLNPTDQPKKHIYIHNKIFFSIASETPFSHSQQKGQDATPSSSSINTDLLNLSRLHSLCIPGLHILHMVVVSYRGFKVIAQCIIPGILSVDHIYCSQYGSIDDGKTVEDNEDFGAIMRVVCAKLGLEDQVRVVDGNGVQKVIAGSVDVKGILGSDKRKYILDLLRLSPRDLNYEGSQNQTCVLRSQLLQSFKKNPQNLQRIKKTKLNTNIGTDIKFIPSENHTDQVALLTDLASFLRQNAIPSLIQTLLSYPSQYLTNNEGLTAAFHSHGVNMRYLGQVCMHPLLKNQLQARMVIQRVIAIRSIKHVIRMAMRQSNIMHLGATIVRVLNAIFGGKGWEKEEEKQEVEDKVAEKEGKKKKKKKNKDGDAGYDGDLSQVINVIKVQPNRFLQIKPQQIWNQVCAIAKARFNHILPKSPYQFQIFKFPFQKLSTLRDVCLSVGLVLQRKNYAIFQPTSTPPFTIHNIISLLPSAKKLPLQPPSLSERQHAHELLISSYQVKQALKLQSTLQQQNLLISGGLNQTSVKLYTRMGRILYILGETSSAISQQQKNLQLMESLFSQDSNLTIQSYSNIGLYCIAHGDRNRVIHCISKAIYLMLCVYGESAPDLLVCYANLARCYQMGKEYKEAIRCYRTAMKIIEQINGKMHVKISFCNAALAMISHEMGDMKAAIQYQTENVAILNKILPDNDVKLQDALKILKMYRDIYQKSEMQNNFANFARVMESYIGAQDDKEKQKQVKDKQPKKKSKKN